MLRGPLTVSDRAVAWLTASDERYVAAVIWAALLAIPALITLSLLTSATVLAVVTAAALLVGAGLAWRARGPMLALLVVVIGALPLALDALDVHGGASTMVVVALPMLGATLARRLDRRRDTRA